MSPKRKRPARKKPPTVEYRDKEGNVLVLREQLSSGTVARIRRAEAAGGATVDDAWRRRQELLFEHLAVSWEIAGLPLTEQAMLLGRYRMADEETRRWVRDTIRTHVDRHLPDLAGD